MALRNIAGRGRDFGLVLKNPAAVAIHSARIQLDRYIWLHTQSIWGIGAANYMYSGDGDTVALWWFSMPANGLR